MQLFSQSENAFGHGSRLRIRIFIPSVFLMTLILFASLNRAEAQCVSCPLPTFAPAVSYSSSNTLLVARDLRLMSGNTAAPVVDSGNANPDYTFRYDPTLGGPRAAVTSLT
jgi:hypothetical protein